VFSAPLWLYGLATLAIPLALHLWSRRPRDVIRVGSLRHVADLAEARSWSARLTEPLHLMLRLGILACIVLALAGPRIPGGHLGATVGQLVLIDPALLSDSNLIRSDPLLDSLARTRATVRLLTGALPKVQLDGVRSAFRVPSSALPGTPRGTRNAERGTLWDLLASADHLVSAGGEMIIIARPRVSLLGGRRPALRARIAWHVPAPAPAVTWAASRWRTVDDSLLALTGWGTARGVRYRTARTPVAGTGEGCAGCVSPGSLSVLVSTPDSVASHRLRVAVLAVATMLGQRVLPAASADVADFILTTAPLSDSVLRLDRPVASLAPAVVGGPALADSVLAHWPWQPLGRDASDPREASISQALPARGYADSGENRQARIPLLLLALVLLTAERWLATRPPRRTA
jgi:hypothetical protein